jgi:hypothetical protein
MAGQSHDFSWHRRRPTTLQCSFVAGSVKQNARGAVVVPFGFAVM